MLCLFPLWCQAKTILIVGDSLSAGYGLQPGHGWASLLQQKIAKNYACYKLVNDSISGDTSSGALARFSKAVSTYHPDIVIIELGGNDGLRGLSLPALQGNLAQMIQLAQQQQAKPLLLGIRLPPNYGLPYISAFLQIYENLAKQYQIPVVDQFLADVNTPAYMQSDGIHPNEKAQPFMLVRVWEGLKPMLHCSL